MNLRQLQCVTEIINARFNLSVAARILHISQPGISRYIQLLEAELEIRIFVRNKNRFTGLTPAGQAIAEVADRTLREVQSISAIARDYRENEVGRLVIATNPGHARYSLPPVMERFIKRYPQVRVRIRQGNSSQVTDWVLSGEAELLIATGPTAPNPDLALFPCHPIHPVALAPPNHPLAKKRRLTIEDLCAYPIITYDAEFAFHAQVMRAFHGKGLKPDIILSATDADIMKMYARAELGVAIVAQSAYDPQKDRELKALNVSHLFQSNILHIGVRRNVYLTKHLLAFIELFAPHLSLEEINRDSQSIN